MTAFWQPLPWDTQFFGFPIGRIDLDGADAEAIARAEAEAREQGIRCLYGAHDPGDAQASWAVQSAGYRLVEAATTFDLHPDQPPIPRPPDVEIRLGTEADLPALGPMIDSLAEWSRFSADPRFGRDAARRMQRAWVERAASCRTGEFELTVAEDTSGILSFVTRRTDPVPTADAVGTTSRGSGASRYLIEFARAWAGDGPLTGGPIAARNVPALRYVAHCGFRVVGVRYLYHRWLDEDEGGRR